MNQDQIKELLLQSLEHERGGIKVYETALECTVNEDLHEEWQRYSEETRNHERILMDVCAKLDIDPEEESPGRTVVRTIGAALVQAMEQARDAGAPEAAEVVACECVVLAETKDHLDWELIGKCAKKLKGEQRQVLQDAADEVEDQEDEHLYHTTGWCRELWMQSLGMKPILPPPEERRHVKTAISAARAKQAARH
jgi:rubrerythrin